MIETKEQVGQPATSRRMGLMCMVAAPIITLTRAMVFSILWGWFIVPLFGLPALSMLESLGILIVITAITGLKITSKPISDEVAEKAILWGIISPLLTLASGFIVKLFL